MPDDTAEPAPQTVTVEDRFEVCPECAYAGGFHILIERLTVASGPNARLRLKCPSCRAVYDVGLLATLGREP